MGLHKLLPLVALLLNVSLVGIALFRNPWSRLNRVFAYFIAALSVWNFGVFMLRRSPDVPAAEFWEVVIHAGVVLLPAFYYHFILIFLDATITHRRSLILAYVVSLGFTAANLSGSSIFMRGVTQDFWGWAPVPGPLYPGFVLFLNTTVVYGLVLMMRAYHTLDSSFRRNRALLVILGSFITLGGGGVDLLRIIIPKVYPPAVYMYPVGIPANMLFALMLGMSIVRYRMFDVSVAVKKAAFYGGLGFVVTSLLVGITWAFEAFLLLEQQSAVWVVVPLGLLLTLMMSPFGQSLDAAVERLMLSRRRGCYETLLALSKRMSGILDFDRLVDELVDGLVTGIPLTHCVLLTRDPKTGAYVPSRGAASMDAPREVAPLDPNGPIVEWLRSEEGVLVKEEAKHNPRIAEYFATSEDELEAVQASLIVPLKIEHRLVGVLLLGEKLSGDIFDRQELEVLSLLANQAAISIQNARLYQEVETSNAQLLQASRAKSQFLASMSHELRTPLNSIIGFSKVLMKRIDGDLNERQETYIRSVNNSSTHLLQLINSILDISRIEAGKMDLVPEEFDLPELVEECVESVAPLVRGKPLKIETALPVEMPKMYADRTKVRQVLINLLSNAIKFTTQGRVLVRARAEPDTVHLSIADTGIGIKQDDLARLFEPFERLDNPRARQADGTGLGLALCKKFLELQGGRIWAESRENQGSTFHVALPLRMPEPAKPSLA